MVYISAVHSCSYWSYFNGCRLFGDNCLSLFLPLLGMKHTISVDGLINYLKTWCVKPQADNEEQRQPEDELVGASFTSTVQHIHSVYNYLYMNCPPSRLKDLFQRTPAVFSENKRYVVWCIYCTCLFRIMANSSYIK